jgi:hypothetical protein
VASKCLANAEIEFRIILADSVLERKRDTVTLRDDTSSANARGWQYVVTEIMRRLGNLAEAKESGQNPAVSRSPAIFCLHGVHVPIAIPSGRVATKILAATERAQQEKWNAAPGHVHVPAKCKHITLPHRAIMVDADTVDFPLKVVADAITPERRAAIDLPAGRRELLVVTRIPLQRNHERTEIDVQKRIEPGAVEVGVHHDPRLRLNFAA